jgi:four helix bundle protein
MKTEIKNQKGEFKKEFQRRLVHFTVDTLKLCRSLREDRTLWEAADQVARSAASIGANVAEARGSGSLRGYKNYFEIALKSANETKYWYTVIAEFEIGDDGPLKILEKELDEIIKILSASILTMKGRSKNIDS